MDIEGPKGKTIKNESSQQHTMKRPYQVTGTLLFVFAAFMVWESLRLRYYTMIGPGPGFFSLWISLFLGLLAAIMFYQATFKSSDPMPDDFIPPKVGYLRICAVIGALFFIVVTMEFLGFRISIFVFLLFLLLVLGRQKVLLTLFVSLGFSWGLFYVFTKMLKVPLPVGVFGI